ncbi:autotransporter [Parazoarcus communis]|uniref:Autotransporter n=1 Tax=Parazoarcus communis TaxID=41977 RepID=A0A2U8H7Y9_9RHOO|nr:autotransporter domain-containing protein [Parazoarcus communis]AWI81690.1 autotransporter [Parazoarcus communis]
MPHTINPRTNTFKRVFMRRTLIASAISIAFTAGPAAAQQSVTTASFDTLAEGTGYFAEAISADGNVIVGTVSEQGFLWTTTDGLSTFAGIPGNASFTPKDVSANGNYVAGTLRSNETYRAVRWNAESGLFYDIPFVSGQLHSWANAVSADGSVVVGSSTKLNFSDKIAYRWTAADGTISLGTLSGYDYSEANDVSANGSVVVGSAWESGSSNIRQAFRWTSATGMESLGNSTRSIALAVSDDGSVIVGLAGEMLSSIAFRWTQASGMTLLGTLAGGTDSEAYDISGDGKVIVGWSLSGSDDRGFRWTEVTGMQSVEDWLRSHGAVIAEDMTESADATNADGSVVVGVLSNGRTYIARVSSAGTGLITREDVAQSLGSVAAGSSMAMNSISTVINGANSRPLARRVANGQKAFWVAGDWGRDDHGNRSGDLGLTEIGGGMNFGVAQLNMAVGHTWSAQELDLNGKANVEGSYLSVFGLIPLGANDDGGLWATIGAYGHWGNADLRRGYVVNGTSLESSKGSPDVTTWAVRARLDWENAFSAGNARFSPYADLSYGEAHLDGYTETGGGFPARFDSRTERNTELRIGVNAAVPVASGAVKLLGQLEAAHRMEKNGSRTSGELIGLFSFDESGQDFDQDWIRAGVGIEGKLGAGKASLMLNGTTKGEALSTWLAASYQVAF